MLIQQLQADRGGERERRPYIVSEEDAGRRVPWAQADDLAVQRAIQGGRIGGLEACLGWVAAARRAGAPEAAQCKSSLPMEVVELQPLIWATTACSQSVPLPCP